MATMPKNKNQSNKIISMLTSKRNISILLIVIIAAFGAWKVFLSGASPNNCQPEKTINICDIDQVQGNLDNILSNGPEAYNLGQDKTNWPLYLGTAFRAPTSSLDGAQPVYRMYNSSVTWTDYLFDAGAKTKQAQNPGKVENKGIAFYAWPSASRTGLVPVFRLTQGGSTTKVIFSTDRAWRDKLVAADLNNPSGWKDGGIPFYAFPANYQAIGTNGTPQPNPYDCSIKENFVSDRCTIQRTNLATAIANGTIAPSNDCPATLDAYLKEPFPSRFTQECQDKWNKEASNCSVKENYVSDRCSGARAAIEQAEQEREAAEDAARKALPGNNATQSSNRKQPNQLPPTSCSSTKIFVAGACRRRSDVTLLLQAIRCHNDGKFWINGACIEGVRGGQDWNCVLNPGQKLKKGVKFSSGGRMLLEMNGDRNPNATYNIFVKGDRFTQRITNLKKATAEQKCNSFRTFINKSPDYRGYTNKLIGPL